MANDRITTGVNCGIVTRKKPNEVLQIRTNAMDWLAQLNDDMMPFAKLLGIRFLAAEPDSMSGQQWLVEVPSYLRMTPFASNGDCRKLYYKVKILEIQYCWKYGV